MALNCRSISTRFCFDVSSQFWRKRLMSIDAIFTIKFHPILYLFSSNIAHFVLPGAKIYWKCTKKLSIWLLKIWFVYIHSTYRNMLNFLVCCWYPISPKINFEHRIVLVIKLDNSRDKKFCIRCTVQIRCVNRVVLSKTGTLKLVFFHIFNP